jgi:hypothetical protein
MNEVFFNCSPPKLGDFLSTAMRAMPGDQAAFFTAGSKPEGLVRDQLALYVHENTDLIAAREWLHRIDLAVLSEQEPLVLIELKAWAHLNALSEKKLMNSDPKHGIAGAFLSDAEKLRKISLDFLKKTQKQPKLFAVNVFFAVGVLDQNVPNEGVVKYAREHRKALQEVGSLDLLCDTGLGKAKSFFETHGETSVHALSAGVTWGIDVRLDALVIEIEASK